MTLLSSTFFNLAAQYGLQKTLVKPRVRKIDGGKDLGVITADAVIEEHHIDSTEITQHPIEVGSTISDHAFMKPAELILHMAWSNSTIGPIPGIPSTSNAIADDLIAKASTVVSSNTYNIYKAFTDDTDKLMVNYNTLRSLQNRFILFTVYTGKRIYQNMLCKELIVETDYKKEESLFVRMTCQQVILVNTFSAPAQEVKTNLPMTDSPTSVGSVNPIPSDMPLLTFGGLVL